MAELYHCYTLFSISFIQYNEVKYMENNHLIPISNLSKLIQHDYTFIDLRDTSQFNKLHITKFINIPYDQFINNPPKLSKNKPIYLICYTGTKSLSLAKKLSLLRQGDA